MKILLIVTAVDWAGIARLPAALQRAGFEVGVICRQGSVISHTRFTDRMWIFDGAFDTVDKIVAVMKSVTGDWWPDIVIPGDDMAVGGLHLAVKMADQFPRAGAVIELLKASLSDPAHFDEIEAKSLFSRVAAASAVEMPPQIAVSDVDDAVAFAERCGWPVLLKPDFSYGGGGIVRCETADELRVALSPEDAKARGRPLSIPVSVQKFIEGEMSGVVLTALRGEVLAAVAYGKLEKVSAYGPSSIIHRLDRPDLIDSARRLVRHLRFSGYGEFEFLIEKDTGRAWLLEMNARPAPVAARSELMGVDLAGALMVGLGGPAPAPAQIPNPTGAGPIEAIALFPQEWKRDPESPALQSAYHDVPWDDPSLLRHLVERAVKAGPPKTGNRWFLSVARQPEPVL